MKAHKVTVKIKIEVLSVDCVPAILQACSNQIQQEAVNGKLVMDDGDTIKWKTSLRKVKI